MPLFNYDNWEVNFKNSEPETRQHFSSIDKVFSCQGELIVKDAISEVIKYSYANKTYYIKRYTASGRKSFDFFRKSRIRSESENLIALNGLGVPVPEVIACGEKRTNGRFMRGALISKEVKNTSNLAQYLTSHPELIVNKKWLHSVIDQLAHHVSIMHTKKFIHRDLNLRNVLVTKEAIPAIYLIDCPAGRFSCGLFLKRGIIRDLAHLDKVARYCLSAKDLLRFYKQYQSIERLSEKDKKNIYKIRHFHDKHRARQNRKSEKAYRVI